MTRQDRFFDYSQGKHQKRTTLKGVAPSSLFYGFSAVSLRSKKNKKKLFLKRKKRLIANKVLFLSKAKKNIDIQYQVNLLRSNRF